MKAFILFIVLLQIINNSITVVLSLSIQCSHHIRSFKYASGYQLTRFTAPSKLSSRFSMAENDQNEKSDSDSVSSTENTGSESKSSTRRQKYRSEYSKEDFQAVLKKELEDFSRTSQKSSLLNDSLSSSKSSATASSTEGSGGGIIKMAKDLFTYVLIADFFAVLVFLVWFIAAAALKDSNPFLLERFQDIFNPIIVPSLTVLMVGSIASGVMGDNIDNK